jgi:D-alanyl-D-alanine carboxypeptidase
VRTSAALGALAILLATGCAAPSAPAPRAADPVVGETPSPVAAEPPAAPEAARTLDLTRHSTTDPTSTWVVVNKRHPLPADFRPELGLVRGYQVAHPAVGPLTRLLDDGDARGLGFKTASAFRSFAYQQQVYAGRVAAGGQAAADAVSARPGHSEHQTGLAVDLVTPADPSCDLDPCFARTPGGRWLARKAWRYGFVVRYQRGDEAVTGYAPEPWHLRYVGRPLAREMRRTGVTTLEELFGVPGGDYP